LTVLAGAGADFFMIALTVTAIVVVVLRALNVKTFFSETKRVKKKERQGERPKTRGRFKTTLSSIFFFVGFWVSKRYEKIASRDFLLLLLLLIFFSIESEKNAPTKVKKMPKEKRGLSKKKKRKRERRGPQLFDHHRPPPSSFLKKKRRDKNRTAEKKNCDKREEEEEEEEEGLCISNAKVRV